MASFSLSRSLAAQAQARPPGAAGNIRELIQIMARDNPTWGEARIANELQLKLGVRVSPRTVARYLLLASRPTPGKQSSQQRWSTFVRNHAKVIVACDFFQSVTMDFRVLYVFVAMEIGSRRILHTSVTAHLTAEWTMQQFRETLPFDHPYRFVIHDRDSIFSSEVDQKLKGFGLRVLKSGSAQESDERAISRGHTEGDEFGLRGDHPLGLEQ